MSRAWLVALALLPAVAFAETRVPVRVVDVAGGRAYLEPGASAGLARDGVVRLRGKSYRVLAVSTAHAVIETGDAPVRPGDRGDAEVKPGAGPGAPRAAPEPLSRFAGQWPEPRWPSEGRRVRPVALGGTAGGAVRLTLLAQGAVTRADSELTRGQLELGARLVAEPWRATPLGFDLDAAARIWLAASVAPVAGTQPDVSVHELRLRYGAARDPLAAIGRLRWVARTVGLLDGIRVRAPTVGGVTVAAFGGFVPDVIDGTPTHDPARFGVDASYAARVVHAALTVWGSTFGGELDERRAAAAVEVTPGIFRFDSQIEVGVFDAANAWGLRRVELLAAGTGAGLRAAGLSLDVRLDARQPERSRALAALLPASYLCGEPCGRRLRLALTAAASWSSRHLALGGGASRVADDGAGGREVAVFGDARVLRVLGRGRLGVGASFAHGDWLDERTLRAEAGVALDTLDVGLHWRGAALDYRAATGTHLEHRAGLEVAWSRAPSLELVLGLEGATGELSSIEAVLTAIWRPLP